MQAYHLGVFASGGPAKPVAMHIPDGFLSLAISLALWALILVVTVKYVLFLMRADNRGEGGVLSLMALAERAVGRRTPAIFLLGVCGAALFYGDAAITPAISVLSAIEGLRSVPGAGAHITPSLVIGLSVALLVGLFALQSRGTDKVGAIFGPVTAVWFVAIAGWGRFDGYGNSSTSDCFTPGEMFMTTCPR